MPGNTFGTLYRATTFGESHGLYVGAVIDGCPPGVELTEEDINTWTKRRAPGQSAVTTQRIEADTPQIYSGVHESYTLGTPIAVVVKNKGHRSKDYEPLAKKYRPSHADFTYHKKYEFMDWRGGGRASNRETLGRVIAGAIAFKVLKRLCPDLQSSCYVRQVGSGGIDIPPQVYRHDKIYADSNPMRCPDKGVAAQMLSLINETKANGDSVGAIVEFAISGVPIGLGDPVFEKITAELARALMSLPASRGVEIGAGFDASKMQGSKHNDLFQKINGEIRTKTNYAGGVLGGISNGELLYGRVGFKPPSTIAKPQLTVDTEGNGVQISGKEGRHDPCVASRAVPVVECMIACVLLDRLLANYAVRSVLNEFHCFNVPRPLAKAKDPE